VRQPYYDILQLTDQEPVWYDEAGVPRFSKFEPGDCNDIYAQEVALVLLECQNCGRQMKCAVSLDIYTYIDGREVQHTPLSETIKKGYSGYGVPPCWEKGKSQCAGSTMTPEEIRVLEFWHRPNGEWERVPELELLLVDNDEYERVAEALEQPTVVVCNVDDGEVDRRGVNNER
jgi:hypothetical protein